MISSRYSDSTLGGWRPKTFGAPTDAAVGCPSGAVDRRDLRRPCQREGSWRGHAETTEEALEWAIERGDDVHADDGAGLFDSRRTSAIAPPHDRPSSRTKSAQHSQACMRISSWRRSGSLPKNSAIYANMDPVNPVMTGLTGSEQGGVSVFFTSSPLDSRRSGRALPLVRGSSCGLREWRMRL